MSLHLIMVSLFFLFKKATPVICLKVASPQFDGVVLSVRYLLSILILWIAAHVISSLKTELL